MLQARFSARRYRKFTVNYGAQIVAPRSAGLAALFR
jgi:hypothetical protein